MANNVPSDQDQTNLFLKTLFVIGYVADWQHADQSVPRIIVINLLILITDMFGLKELYLLIDLNVVYKYIFCFYKLYWYPTRNNHKILNIYFMYTILKSKPSPIL